MNEPMADISRHVWETKYRYAHERTITDSWRRISAALAAVEPSDPVGWEARYFCILQDFRFLPGGRIQAGAGTARNVTLFNCFVMGPIEDSIPGIFKALQEGAVTMQQGGGIGLDFSTLRPRGTLAKGTGTVASGPVSFMQIWEAMCGTILSTGARRGAMMATLRCDHPDIEELRRCQAAAGTIAPVQPVDPGDGCFHGGGAQRCRMAIGISGGGIRRRWQDGVATMAGRSSGGALPCHSAGPCATALGSHSAGYV